MFTPDRRACLFWAGCLFLIHNRRRLRLRGPLEAFFAPPPFSNTHSKFVPFPVPRSPYLQSARLPVRVSFTHPSQSPFPALELLLALVLKYCACSLRLLFSISLLLPEPRSCSRHTTYICIHSPPQGQLAAGVVYPLAPSLRIPAQF